MPPDRRALTATAGSLACAAAALGGAAALPWVRQPFTVPLRGTVTVTVDGSAVAPGLGPLALLALAAVAAVVATAGWLRRALGLLLLAAAVAPASAAARTLAGGASVTGTDVPARAVPIGPVTVLVTGPITAALGATLLAAAGVALATASHRMSRLGARYRTPAAARARPVTDRERLLWDTLDAGDDPTVNRRADPR